MFEIFDADHYGVMSQNSIPLDTGYSMKNKIALLKLGGQN